MSVEEFFYDLPEQNRKICERLRLIILNTAVFEEEFYYGVPYYFRNRAVTCIWPAGLWGGPKRGVFIGFSNGNFLSNTQGIIEMGNRKRFGLIRYLDEHEIKEQPLIEILHEAIMIDDELGLRKKKHSRPK